MQQIQNKEIITINMYLQIRVHMSYRTSQVCIKRKHPVTKTAKQSVFFSKSERAA